MTEFNNNNKFVSQTPKTYEVRYVENENKQSKLSPAARNKIINKSGSNYLSEKFGEINPVYGPASDVSITSSSEIVFISSQKYGESSWERTEEPDEYYGNTGVIKQGSEWQTQTLSAGLFDNEKNARLLLQKLENGEIKVEKKAEFTCDFSLTSDYYSFHYIPHHETAESKRLKEETIKAFRENVEAQEKFVEKMLHNASWGSIAAFTTLGEEEKEKIQGAKKI